MALKIPQLIELVLNKEGHGQAIRIDGEELTLPVGREVSISLGDGGRLKSLNVSIYAADIRIVDVDAEPEEPKR